MPSLDSFFRPRTVAMIGATDKSAWSQLVFGNFARFDRAGTVYMVNRKGTPAHGRPAVASCAELPDVPDLAYIMLPTEAVAGAIADATAAGIRNLMILSSGYAETGEDGARAQAALVAAAHAGGARLLGPNSLGFINYADAIAVSPFPAPPGVRAGHVAIASQSGATAQVIAGFAAQQGIGLSHTVATGNEADLDMSAIIDFLVDDPATRVIALFAETVKKPLAFRHATRRAARAGKPIVILKAGKSALASQLAQAHTGSVTGDDATFDAMCARDALVRVYAIEELVTTAGLMASYGGIAGGLAVVSISGGACEIIADAGEAHGLSTPQFSAETLGRLRDAVADYGATYNPLDITGAAVRDPDMFARILPIVDEDPAIALTACVYDLPKDGEYHDPKMMAAIGAGLRGGRRPGVLVNQSLRPVDAHARELLGVAGIPGVIGGLDLAVRAFAAAQQWARRRHAPGPDPLEPTPGAVRPTAENDVLDYLQSIGVQTPPRVCASSADEAVAAWRAMGGPIVLKIASSAIAHKSDIGGVRLDLDDETAISDAFAAIMANARRHCPDAPLDGCLVMPMRRGGVELFAGTALTPWGPALTVGLGGVWVELLADVSTRLLPVGRDEVLAMLAELRGHRLLDGYRGASAVDKDALAEAIVGIGDAALGLGSGLVSLEVNPLWANGRQVEPLDALAVWAEA